MCPNCRKKVVAKRKKNKNNDHLILSMIPHIQIHQNQVAKEIVSYLPHNNSQMTNFHKHNGLGR